MTANASKAPDVVIVGGGVMGCATAYFLGAEHGLRCVIVERDAVASQASGGAAGELGAVGRHRFSPSYTSFILRGIDLHNELAPVLKEESGIDYLLSDMPFLRPAFEEDEARELQEQMPWQRELGIDVQWLDASAVHALGSWLAPDVIGAAWTVNRQLEAYPFALAVAQAAEHHGAEIRSGEVTGLERDGDRVTGVRIGAEVLSAGAVVVAAGPWTKHAGAWMGIDMPIYPLRGQIVHVALPNGAPLPQHAIFHPTGYMLPKPGGDLLVGTTQEDVGFDKQPTIEAQNGIMEAVIRLAPPLIDAPIRDLTACLRPYSRDELPIMGTVPGWDGLYVNTGHGYKGVTLALISGRCLAQLMAGQTPDVPMEDYSPARLATAG